MKLSKKALILTLTLTLILSCLLSGCGKDFSKRTVTRFDEEFRWDMSVSEAAAYIKNHQEESAEITVKEYADFTVVTDGNYTFRFNNQGRLALAKLNLGTGDDALDLAVSWYGQWDNHEKGTTTFDRYEWYANMAGRNVTITLYQPGAEFYLEYTPE